MTSRPRRSSAQPATLSGREAVILALLVLGIGAGAVLGVLNQPPPRKTTTEVVTTLTRNATTEVVTTKMPSAPIVVTFSVVPTRASSYMPLNDVWQTFESTRHGYRIQVPPTWTVRADFPDEGSLLATYVPSPGGPPVPLAPGDTPPQEAEVDETVLPPPVPVQAMLGDAFCVGSVCGLRLQEMPRWTCTDPACVQQLATQPRQVSVQLVKDGNLYLIHATIGGPPSAIERNAEMVEAILKTFAFVE